MAATTSAPEFTPLYPARDGTRPFTAEDLWRIPRVGSPVPHPSGEWLAVPVTTYDVESNRGRTRIWRVPAAGGEPRPLTAGDCSSKHPAFSPDGARLAFVRKREDDEKWQLHVLEVDGGEAEKLTDLPLGAADPRWLPDGSGVVLVSQLLRGHLDVEATKKELARRADDPVKAHVTEDRVYRFWDKWLTTGEVPHLFVLDLATRAVRDLTPESTLWFGWMEDQGHFDVAPDGEEVAFSGVFVHGPEETLRSGVFVVPVAGGAVRCLTEAHPHRDFRPRYTPDGTAIVHGMALDPGFYADRTRLLRFDRASGEHRDLLTDWDLSPEAWELDGGGSLFFLAQTDGRTCLYRLGENGEPERLTTEGTVSGPAPAADGRVYASHQSLSQPAEVVCWSAEGSALRRLTEFSAPALEGVALGAVQDVRFTGAEGETVQMFVLEPPMPVGDHPPPLVHVVHGGPHGITADAFHPRWNAHLFAAPGYLAAAVNFQGSTSWGQDFAQRIQGGWGDRPCRDILAATDVLVAAGRVDPERMAAAGGSYGGYMAAWLAGATDRFRCVVNHAGVYDLLAQYASDVTQGRAQSFGGTAWDGLEAVLRWSPAHHADTLATPMLVIHGERDYRVPVTQGLHCYNVLKAKGVPARLVYFPDENHWVLKPRNSLLWYAEVHAWLERFLGGGAQES